MIKPKPKNTVSNNTALINGLREADVAKEFKKNIGRRVFIMISPFPFMVIGNVIRVEADRVQVLIETTHISEIEGRIITIHFDSIQVFYIERPCFPKIPRIKELSPHGEIEE